MSDDVVLRTRALTKQYGARLAVDALDLEIRRGRVYGFLGPNGAGKTTTIAMLLGLLAPSSGGMEILGHDAASEHATALRRTGAVLDGLGYFPHLTGRDNVRLWARLNGMRDAARIDAVIEIARLSGRADDKVRDYSLGMKQRLAVAVALLEDPELLILDEPTNGLDPAGIREFRQLIRQLAADGKTVFVSSHLLSEVQQMCDDVGIVKHGKLIAQGEVTTLVQSGTRLVVRATDPRALAVLKQQQWVAAATLEDDGTISVEAPADKASDISRVLAGEGIWLSELRAQDGSLEEFFLDVTGEETVGA